MKICYLADSNSIHTQKWVKYFVEKGYKISLISFSPHKIEGTKSYFIKLPFPKSISPVGSNFLKLQYFLSIFKIRKIVNKIKPDILHSHWATSYGIVGSFINYHPFIVSVWGSDIYEFPYKSIIHKWLIKRVLKSADRICSTSIVMSKEIAKFTNKKIFVTPFGVDVEKFKPPKQESNKKYFTIGTIKSLEEKYGLEYLIRAFAILKKQLNDKKIKLEIYGKGSQEEYLKKLSYDLGLSNVIGFKGYISHDLVPEKFQCFDIAVFPSISDSESFGVAAIEAQACGVPVVVSNVGGLPEVVNNGKTGFVVPPKDSYIIAKKILYLYENKNIRKKMGNTARKFVIENYVWENNAKIMSDKYLELLK
ncbi:MAG: glycosyltransferase [Candidatus Cloacimonetes bacterium]|nr:glycosyltransferase [Candidatus Cloacimonadota bacterium]MBL7086268.1 glycosyltransferase [Candidatus Cloacimonadota bacterium]